MGILDTIIDSKRQHLGKHFEPVGLVERVLALLKSRDKQILAKRYGLANEMQATLEAIGRELQLTRERVRQIEKQLLSDLRKQSKDMEDFKQHADLLHSTITDHGGIMAEADLLEALGAQAQAEARAVRFLLVLVDGIEEVSRHRFARDGWRTLGFDESMLQDFLSATHAVLEIAGKPKKSHELLELLKTTDVYKNRSEGLTDQVMKNFLAVANSLAKNPLGELGLKHWSEVTPRDVGDKAYLALRHQGKPTHYLEITKLINKLGFSGRAAHEETVHNELIKDQRFVLVGRGIYALKDWGYKPGVVADVIEEILRDYGKPMERERLMSEVEKRRQVKRNTVLVSLANRKRFKKVGKDEYGLVDGSGGSNKE